MAKTHSSYQGKPQTLSDEYTDTQIPYNLKSPISSKSLKHSPEILISEALLIMPLRDTKNRLNLSNPQS